MSDVAVGGPLAVDRLGIGNNWTPISNSKTPSSQRASEPGADGDEIVSALYDAKTEISDEFVCTELGEDLFIPKVGFLYTGYLITGFRIVWNPTGFPKMTATAHNHGANAHAAPAYYYQGSLLVSAIFGIPLLGTLGSVAGRASMEYEVSCDHIDELDGVGGHLCGVCLNGQEKLTLGFTGVPTTPLANAEDWDLISPPETGGNQAFNKYTYVYQRALTRTAV